VPDLPLTSPITELAAGAAQTHELYSAYVEAGFTPDQAMQLICCMLAESFRHGLSG
jgi:hypothetical protein